MSVYTPSSHLNHVLDDGTITDRSPLRSGGHPDAEFDYDFGYSRLSGEQEQALAEIESDRAIQAADDSHRCELEAAYATAKQAVGAESVKIGRQIVIDDYSCAGPTTSSHWFCCIGVTHYGIGAFAAEAVDHAVAAFCAAANAA